MKEELVLRWEIRKREHMNYPTEDERKLIKLGSCGDLETDINLIRELDKMCFEYGYNINNFLGYIIEHITIDQINEILFAMDNEPRTEE